MKTYELLNHGSNKMKLNKIISHKLDSEILLSKVLKINREQVLINLDQIIKKENKTKTANFEISGVICFYCCPLDAGIAYF